MEPAMSRYVLPCLWCDEDVELMTAKPRIVLCEQCAAEAERLRRDRTVSSE
jgi:hypothetical protein